MRRLFSETPVVKIVDNEAAQAGTVTKISASSAGKSAEKPLEKMVNAPKVEKEIPKTENVTPKKKRSVVKPFLFGCVVTLISGYFFVYRQIWDSAHQMEQSIADMSVDISESMDKLEQRVSRLESRQ